MFNGNLGFNPYDKNHNAVGTAQQIAFRANFLASFGGQHIFCYNGNPRKKISSMKHTDNLSEVAFANNSQNSDAYFYVNGGRKQYAISKIRSCFVDMDAGRDSSGNYLPAKEVMKLKEGFLKKINEFPVTPSWVVDTRNGYQVYWILDSHSQTITNKTTWNGVQKKLVNYFGGDARAIKINQIYRVPYTWWRKCWEKKAPYFTSILSGSTGIPVSIIDLKSALSGQPATVNIVPNATSDAWFEQWRKTYKNADESGVSVTADAASKILQTLSGGQTHGYNTGPTFVKNTSCTMKNSVWNNYDPDADRGLNEATARFEPEYNTYQKAYGDPSPVLPSHAGDSGLDLNESQAKLLKTVVEYLNQASTALYFSNNRFLSGAARDLANQISDQFCIG